MTYSLTEKEEVLLERKLEELFTLTELDPNEYIKEPAIKKVKYKGKDVTRQQADWLKQAVKTSHWTDMYKWVEPEPAHPAGKIDTPEPPSHDPNDPNALVTNPNYKQPPVPADLTAAAALTLGYRNRWSPAGKSPSQKLKITGAQKKPPSKIRKTLSRINPHNWANKNQELKPPSKQKQELKPPSKQKQELKPPPRQKPIVVSPEDIDKEKQIIAKHEKEQERKRKNTILQKDEKKLNQKIRKFDSDYLRRVRKQVTDARRQAKAANLNATKLKTPAAKKAAETAQKNLQNALRKLDTAELKAEKARIDKETENRKIREKNQEELRKRADAERRQTKLKLKAFRQAEYASRKALIDYEEALKNKNLSPEKIQELKKKWAHEDNKRLATQEALKQNRSKITGIKDHLTQSKKQSKHIQSLEEYIKKQELASKKTPEDVKNIKETRKKVASAKTAQAQIEDAARKGVKQINYKLKKGETISQLGKRYGVNYREIMKFNGITDESAKRLPVGADIKIPVKGDISPTNIKPIPPKTRFQTSKNLGPSASNPERHLIRGKNGQYYLQNPANKMDNKPLTHTQAKIELSKMGAQAETGVKAQNRKAARKSKKVRPPGRMGLRGGAGLLGFHMLLSGTSALAYDNFVKKYDEDRNKLPENSPLRKLSPNQFYNGQQFFPGKNPFTDRPQGKDKNFYEYGVGTSSGSMTNQVNSRSKMFNDKFSSMTERDLNSELFLPLDQRDEQFEIVVQKPDGSYINVTEHEKRAKKKGEILDPNTFINDGDVVLYTQSISNEVAKQTWTNMAKKGTQGTATWLDIKYNMRTSRMKVFYMTRGNKDHLDTKYHAGGTHEHSLNPNWDPSDYVGKRADELGNERKLGVGIFSKKGFQGNINMQGTWRRHNELMKEFRAAELEAVRKGQQFDPSSIYKKFGMTEDELFALLPAESMTGLDLEGDESSSSVADYIDDTISDFGEWTGLYDYQSTSERKIDKVVKSGLEGDEPSAIAGQGIASSGWPADTQTYNTLITKLSTEYEIDPKLLKALSQKESGTSVVKGELKQGIFKGDTDRGTRGAWGLFHVRKGEIRQDDQGNPYLYDPAVVDEYNLRHGTTYQWSDVAGDALLAAHIGADTFAVYYKEALETNSDPMKAAEEAYAKYNGGPNWRNKSDAKANAKIFVDIFKKLHENKTYTKKSAILEGIAKAA